MRVVVPWDRVALGLELPVLVGKPLPNPVVRARELQRALAVEGSDADVARAFGMTRAGVCQYLTLVRRLPAELLDQVEAETDPRCLRKLTLRRLLEAAAADDPERQRAKLEALLRRPG
jgi:DNA-binding transcriptional regulator YdaS (Cro superfamily)